MVSKETSFHNELEVTDYTVTDDGITVVLKGSLGEMWASKLSKVISTYTRPDGSELSEKDFAVKDTYIDILTRDPHISSGLDFRCIRMSDKPLVSCK